MTTLPEYLNTLLPGRVLPKAPAIPPTDPYVIWEQGVSGDALPLYDEGGRRQGVKVLTLTAYLYVSGEGKQAQAADLTRQIVEAENRVIAHPGLTFVDFREISSIGPIWNNESKRWISTVRFALRHVKT